MIIFITIVLVIVLVAGYAFAGSAKPISSAKTSGQAECLVSTAACGKNEVCSLGGVIEAPKGLVNKPIAKKVAKKKVSTKKA